MTIFKNKIKKIQGITLISLIITIIILLILAGITISQLTGNGIFAKVKQAKQEHENAQELENSVLGEYENEINSFMGISRGDITIDCLYESDSASTELNLNSSYKQYKCIFFMHTGNSTIRQVRSVVFPVAFMNKIRDLNEVITIDGWDKDNCDISIISDKKFEITLGNEYIYAIYGIK